MHLFLRLKTSNADRVNIFYDLVKLVRRINQADCTQASRTVQSEPIRSRQHAEVFQRVLKFQHCWFKPAFPK